MSRIGLSLLFILIAAVVASAETEISGTITQEAWTLEGSPYVLVGDAVLPEDGALVIHPGVVVRGTAGTLLTVNGTLEANGEGEDGVIRFIADSPEHRWDGLRINWGSASFTHCEFAGAGTFHESEHGGAVDAMHADVSFNRCRFHDNEALALGAAVYAVNSEFAMEHCRITWNESGHAGALAFNAGTYEIHRTLIANNEGAFGGAIFVGEDAYVHAEHCTIAYNLGEHASTFQAHGELDLTNTIAWAGVDMPIVHPFEEHGAWANWADIDSEQIPGEHIIHADPLFMDPWAGGYNLTAESPCIDAGDPDFPLDPDGTRTDLGAYPFYQEGGGEGVVLALPDVMGTPGTELPVPILIHNVGPDHGVVAYEVVIEFNPEHLEIVEVGIPEDGPAGEGWLLDWNVTEAHLHISASGPEPLPGGGPIARIQFAIGEDVPIGETDELPIVEAMLNEGEPPVEVDGGSITYGEVMYGDVSGNGEIQAFDASLILGFLAGNIELSEEQQEIGDVSGDDELSSLDAGLILAYTVGNIDDFPVVTGDWWGGSGEPSIPAELIVDADNEANLDVQVLLAEDVLAGELAVSFDASELELLSVDALSEGATAVMAATATGAEVFVARTDPLQGDGVLLRMRFALAPGVELSAVNFDSIQLNEFLAFDDFGATEIARSTAVGDGDSALPAEHGLVRAYPNPFNARVNVSIGLQHADRVALAIYDVLGRAVHAVPAETMTAGEHTLSWNASANASGLYFVHATVGGETSVRKLMLVR